MSITSTVSSTVSSTVGSSVGAGSGGGAPPTSYLIIAAGESNAGGAAPNASATVDELAERSGLHFWNVSNAMFESLNIGTNNNLDHANLNSTTHGIELELANIIESGRFSADVYYLQTGQGGSNIQDWLVGSATGFWSKFVARFNAAVAAIPGEVIPVVFYSQGINDAIGNNLYGGAGATIDMSVWKTRTIAHLAKIRELVGETTLIVMTKFRGQISLNSKIVEIGSEDSNTVVIETDDETGVQWQVDGNHWSYVGYKEVCNRFVDEIFSDASTATAILPIAGTYDTPQDVTLTGTNARYTSSGIDPHIGSVYSGEFTITPPLRVRARAYEVDKKSSLTEVDYLSSLSAWNTSDAAAGGMTLSYANIDILQSALAWKTCKISTSKSAGKHYVEFRCVKGTNQALQMIGACTAAYAVSNHLFGASGGCCVWLSGFATGGAFTSGSGSNSYAPKPITGDVFAVAIDFDAGKLWIGKNNTWMDGDPAAGTSPQFTFTANTTLHAAMSFYQDTARWRVLSGVSNQQYSPPSGFSSWM